MGRRIDMTTDTAAIARAGLLEIQRAAGESTWIDTHGISMLPGIPPGSRLLVDLGRRPARVGEVIVFRRGGELIAHRLVTRRHAPEGLLLVAKGDNEPLADRPVPADAILGVVRAVQVPTGSLRAVPLRDRRGWLVARLSWSGDRASRVGRRLARKCPARVRQSIEHAALTGSIIPVRVTVATMLRLDRSEPAGRR
jgi:signal peptidase I